MKKLIMTLAVITAVTFAINAVPAKATSLAGTRVDKSVVDRFPGLLGAEATGQSAQNTKSAAYDRNCFQANGINMVAQKAYLASANVSTGNTLDAPAITTPFMSSNGYAPYFGYFSPLVDPEPNRMDIQDYRMDGPIKVA